MTKARELTSVDLARMDGNGGYRNTLGIELPLQLLRPKDNGKFRKAVAGHLWPRVIFAFTVEIVDGAELYPRSKESVPSRRKLKTRIRLGTVESVG